LRFQTVGPQHITLATSYHNLGLLHLKRKHFEDAIKSYKLAVNIRQTNHDDNDNNMADSLHQLAYCYELKRDFRQAIYNYQYCFRIRRKLEERQSGKLIPLYETLGKLYFEIKEYKKSIDCYHNAADWYFNLENFEKSIEYNKKALDIGKQKFGRNNLNVAITCYNLGFSYNRKGDHRKAVHWFSESLNIRLGLLDPYDLRMADTYKMVAESYYCNNELSNAIDAFEKAIDIFLKQPARAKFNELTYCYDKLSAIYMENSQPTQAIDTATKLLQNYINLGICAITKHQLTYALKKLDKGLDIYNKILPPFDTAFIFVYEQFAILYQKQKKWDLASQYRHKAAE
ncbi:hypothetical protein RFI_30346, partial [Reticulomyxa filosa]